MARLNKTTAGSWSPPLFIEQIAKRMLSDPVSFGLEDTPELAALVTRLTFDLRMKAVWRQLLRPKGAERFFYPVRTEALNPYVGPLEYAKERMLKLRAISTDDDARAELRPLMMLAKNTTILKKSADAESSKWPDALRQESACAGFFSNIVQFAMWDTSVFTIGDVDVAMRELRSIANQLETSSHLASMFLKMETPSVIPRMVDELRRSASLFEYHKNDPLVVKRRRSDDRLRAFAIRLTARAQEIFGQHLHGQIATIGNIVFEDEKITQARIREMVRDRAASKGGG